MKKLSITLILLISLGILSCTKDTSTNSVNIKTPNTKVELPQVQAVPSRLCANLPASMRDGLVAFYPFCGNANDISGNGNNPTFNNASLVPDRFGNPNSAYSFNGEDQYIKGPSDNYPANSRTISIWFKANSLIPHNTLLAYGGGVCGTSFLSFLNHGPQPNAYAVTGHCEFNNCFTNCHYPPTGWNNWIITSGDGATKFYLNGELIQTCNKVSFSNTDVHGREFAFGTSVNSDGTAPWKDPTIDYFNGDLDDIVIYNRVLSDTEAKNLYQYFTMPSIPFCDPGTSTSCSNPGTPRVTPSHDGKTLFLTWDPNSTLSALSFRVVVNNLATGIVKDTTFRNDRIAQNSYRIRIGQFPNGSYQWKAQAICSNGPGQFVCGPNFSIPW